MTKKLTFFTLVLILFYVGAAQDLEALKYNISGVAEYTQLTVAEQAEEAVIIDKKVLVEYLYDNQGDLKYYYSRYIKVNINKSSAVEYFNRLYLQVDNPETILEVRIRTVNKNGEEKNMSRQDLKETEEDGKKMQILAIEGAETGSQVEFFYSYQLEENNFGNETAQGAFFTRNYEFYIITPENLRSAVKTYNDLPAVKDTSYNGMNFKIMKASNIPALESEKYSASKASLKRIEYKLDYNNYTHSKIFTFGEAGKNYYIRTHFQKKESEKDIKKLASELKLKRLTEEEKIITVENYLKSNIAVIKNSDSQPVKDILKNKYCNVSDITRLFVLLFESQEIPCEVVRTCDRMEKKFDPDFETWDFLDEYLIFFSNTGKFLKPDDILIRYDMIPPELTATFGLFIKPVMIGEFETGVAKVKKIPYTLSGSNTEEMDLDIAFNIPDNKVNLKYRHSMTGYPASFMRPVYFLQTEEKRKKLIDDLLKSYYGEDIQISDLEIENYNINSPEIKKPFIISSDIIINTMTEAAGNKVLFKVGEAIGPQTVMYDEKPRQTDVEIDYTHQYIRKIRVQIPDGYTLKGQEALNKKIVYPETNPVVGFESSYKLTGNILEINCHEFYNDLTYPISVYNYFRDVVNAAADFNKITLVLEES
jgi:hypothetical protein